MRMALRAFTPPMLVGGCVGIGLIVFLHNLTLAALIWILCYGLALLSTASFSPRSLPRLGWAFVITGLLLFFTWAANRDVDLLSSDLAPASLAMGLTFGLLHVVYALAVFLTKKPAEVQPK
jgi:amino acid permease